MQQRQQQRPPTPQTAAAAVITRRRRGKKTMTTIPIHKRRIGMFPCRRRRRWEILPDHLPP